MKFMNYEIKFGIEATTKSGILKRLKKFNSPVMMKLNSPVMILLMRLK